VGAFAFGNSHEDERQPVTNRRRQPFRDQFAGIAKSTDLALEESVRVHDRAMAGHVGWVGQHRPVGSSIFVAGH